MLQVQWRTAPTAEQTRSGPEGANQGRGDHFLPTVQAGSMEAAASDRGLEGWVRRWGGGGFQRSQLPRPPMYPANPHPDLEADGLVSCQSHGDGGVQADDLPQPRIHGVGEAQAT